MSYSAETMAALPTDKADRYAEIGKEIAAVIEGEPSHIARMASIASLLHHAFDSFFWTGFYLVDPDKGDELVVGPYQGTTGCLRIPFGRGVCGTAAADRRTLIVRDVEAFPGHIACDARSRSEIVVPVLDGQDRLIAVLDVDSDRPGAFDEADQAGLEAILHDAFSRD